MSGSSTNIPVLSMEVRPPKSDAYPSTLPFFSRSRTFAFELPVTLLVGENGSGKSAFLSVLAAAAGLPTVGGTPLERDPELSSVRAFARSSVRLAWRKKSKKGLFMQSGDFFAFRRRINDLRHELREQAEEFDRTLQGYGRELARGVVLGQEHALKGTYGDDLCAQSHGEGLLKLLSSRVVNGGLHVLDEPELALSPKSALALVALIKSMLATGAQFIIATHSPVIMACPGAAIWSFDDSGIESRRFDDVDSVQFLRDFLRIPAAFVERL